MTYTIKITKQVINENYEQEMSEWRENEHKRSCGLVGFYGEQPSKFFPITCLEMDLEEAEFHAVRKACVEAIK